MTQSVYITGLSTVSSAGMNIEETWASVQEGKTGIGPITQWDVSDWQFPLAGELKNYKPRQMVSDKKLLKLISRHDVIGLCAASQAISDAKLTDFRDELDDPNEFNDKTGVYVGSPGNKFFQQYDFLPLLEQVKGDMNAFAEHLFEQVHPMWLLKILPNNVLAYTGILHGFKGPNQNVTNHVVSGLQALIEAYYAIQTGQAERAVVVAYDMGFEAEALLSYAKLGIISPDGLNAFDASHNGTVMAEGAGAIILESEASMKKRGVTPYAQMLAGASTSDAMGIFSLDDEAQQLKRLYEQLLQRSHLSPEDFGMICAHANGNIRSDLSEAAALSSVFANIPVSGFKWATGHTLAASGVIDAALTAKAMKEKCIPGLAQFKQAAKGCESLSLSSKAREMTAPAAMVVSRGFGGMNCGMVMKACD